MQIQRETFKFAIYEDATLVDSLDDENDKTINSNLDKLNLN